VPGQREEKVLRSDVVVSEPAGVMMAESTMRIVSASQRSNMVISGSSPASSSDVVLLVHGLATHAERTGDQVPRPSDRPGIVDVEFFEFLDQIAKCSDRREPDRRIPAGNRAVETGQLAHRVSDG